jgi:3-dehydroquinate dehydratase II
LLTSVISYQNRFESTCMKIAIINGPNLNLLGIREKAVYGHRSFEDYYEELKTGFPELELQYFQSNNEGELIDKLHETGFNCQGVVLNAGGYSHTSVALADAVAAVEAPVVEVHISNIFARESFRHKSLLSARCKGTITGFGLESYRLALQYFIRMRPNRVGFSFAQT